MNVILNQKKGVKIADYYGYGVTELERLLDSVRLMLLAQFSVFVDW